MSEFLTLAAVAATAGAWGFYWGWRGGKQPVVIQVAPAESVEPTLSDLMRSLDQPRTRARTVSMGRQILDQYGANNDVGLVVIAVEDDAIHLHAITAPDEELRAIGALLDCYGENPGIEAARIRACRRMLGLKEAT